MDAYLFNAGVKQSQVRSVAGSYGESLRTWDASLSAIVYGGELEGARKTFERWCQLSPEGQNPIETEIRILLSAPMLGELLTESGGQPLDWREMSRRSTEALHTTPVDDFEQGYWVDINQVLPPGPISYDIDSLKRDLPEDIRSGLNWSQERTFLFLVSVLRPPPPPPDPDAEFADDTLNSRDQEPDAGQSTGAELDDAVAALPEMREKESAALVEARNSVVAGWLWRKYAVETPLAQNEIHIGQCCSIYAAE